MSLDPRTNTPSSTGLRLSLRLPPPQKSMAPRPLTTADRDLVRADFVACYDALLEQKDLVLVSESSTDRKDAIARVIELVVSTFLSASYASVVGLTAFVGVYGGHYYSHGELSCRRMGHR
jgi:hypothetical protein